MQVTACHAGTTDMDLAFHADRHFFAMLVQQVDLRIGYRLADMWCAPLDGCQRGIHRAFGRAIDIVETGGWRSRQGAPGLCGNRFSTHQHRLDLLSGLLQKPGCQHQFELRGCAIEGIHLMLDQEIDHRRAIAAYLLWHQHYTTPGQQLGNGLDRSIKRK